MGIRNNNNGVMARPAPAAARTGLTNRGSLNTNSQIEELSAQVIIMNLCENACNVAKVLDDKGGTFPLFPLIILILNLGVFLWNSSWQTRS